ncbi:U6 small nuclear RNA (adenine-(43)-N(6))-methyltransferase [Anopheles bellator]|uniref:U6 small nuclear RNA (adenine-(43)-N(6))-methyltransferase n=1 Tax=Anopheles bellator TaxID=139047 RepID=UPI002648DFA9|nr:U6 small nuclear RNA (adenine-(43)-N(6))-methyltransferase [Anopheles bellator]
MSVNGYMHPRNRYREKPDHQELIKQFPELAQVSVVDLHGRVRLDYKNPQTLQALTKCLLLKDFGLTLELPPDKLVPTLPLRMNYIHWLEDIGSVAEWKENDPVRGIDIGCGASCIYPLLAVVQSERRWNMLAIEKTADSLVSAKANVCRNNLENHIRVLPQVSDGSSILVDVLKTVPDDERFHFSMCNPPFYDSTSTVEPPNRTGKRREPPNAKTGSGEELSTHGGEVQFIGQMIRDSLQLKDRISVYTTMVGHKRSYEEVLRLLRRSSVHNTTVTRFCQGNTTRWAVAWSFDARVLLSRLTTTPTEAQNKQSAVSPRVPGKPVSWKIFDGHEMPSIDAVYEFLSGVLQSIAIQLRTPTKDEKLGELRCEFTAYRNTWSHQRRQRRQAQRSGEMAKNPNEQETSDLDEAVAKKRLRVDASESNEPDSQQNCEPYLRAAVLIHLRDDDYHLSLQYINGIGGKDGVNQVLQFIKNYLQMRRSTPTKT